MSVRPDETDYLGFSGTNETTLFISFRFHVFIIKKTRRDGVKKVGLHKNMTSYKDII